MLIVAAVTGRVEVTWEKCKYTINSSRKMGGGYLVLVGAQEEITLTMRHKRGKQCKKALKKRKIGNEDIMLQRKNETERERDSPNISEQEVIKAQPTVKRSQKNGR